MNMNRLHAFLSVFLMAISCMAEIKSGSCGYDATYILDTEIGLLKIEGWGDMDGYSYSTAVPWYQYRSIITNIQITNGITSIGDCAFYECKELSSITMPNSITSIGENAFYGCIGLTQIEIPSSVTTIEGGAFRMCNGLRSITIPNSVRKIGNYAFSECNGLTSISIPNSVSTISYRTFYKTVGLTSVSIPNSIITIEQEAFSGCRGFTSITIPNSVNSIEAAAFQDCSGLTSVDIPNSVTNIDSYVFAGCNNLNSVNIPNSITKIGASAFEGCTGLMYINIPSSVTSIGKFAFHNCVNLTQIIYTNTLFAFLPSSYSGEFIIPDGITDIIGGAFWQCGKITSVIMPNTLRNIGNSAFAGCCDLKSINIPNSVTNIGGYAFDGCCGLSLISIPNSVKSIDFAAFGGCDGLTKVELGSSITSIGGSAFVNCHNIQEVVWNPKNCQSPMSFTSFCPTILTIGDSVTTMYDNFKNHKKLRNISIGKNVAIIRAEAFGDCGNLHSVTSYAKEPPVCYPNVFKNKPADAVLTVYTSAADAYRKADKWKDFIIQTMPDPRDGLLASLQDLYNECSAEKFPTGNENGQYGIEEVKKFNIVMSYVGLILFTPADYCDEEIQDAINELKLAYQAVLSSKVECFTIADITPLNILTEQTFTNLIYTRKFNTTDWEPLYIPLALHYEDWADIFEVAEINNFHQYDTDGDNVPDLTELEIFLIDNGTLEPNDFYLIRAKSVGEYQIKVSDRTVYPVKENSYNISNRKYVYNFSSTYSEEELSNIYTLQDGELVFTPTIAIKPQRWYMTIKHRGTSKAETPQRIRIRSTEEYVDGVKEIENGLMKTDNSPVYDLQGRRVLKLGKGIYIQNGNKIMM